MMLFEKKKLDVDSDMLYNSSIHLQSIVCW